MLGLLHLLFFVLDMLSVEELQNSIRYSIQLDHCYTTRLSPSDPAPRDPLPVADSPESNDVQYAHQPSSPRTSVMSSSVGDADNVKSKNIVKNVNVILTTSLISAVIKYYFIK